jgi:DUF4097 and DUF4098 domain-containing protein YvlB
MNKLAIAALCLSFSAASAAGEAVDRRVDADPKARVRIDIVRGSVTVEGWDQNAVHVQGTRDDDSREFIVERDGRDILIEDELKGHSSGRDRDGTQITVRVPRGGTVEMDTVSANQEVRGVDGGVRLEAVSGDINAGKLGGEADLSTVSGNITLADAGGEIRLESVSGDVEARVNAGRLDVESVSGHVDVDNAAALERLEGSTISGNLEVRTKLAPNAEVSLESVSGDLELVLLGDIDARFNLETGPGGNIENGLTDQSPKRERYVGSESLAMRVGQGGADVDVSVVSGTITISKE